jgi:hypothetical protein
VLADRAATLSDGDDIEASGAQVMREDHSRDMRQAHASTGSHATFVKYLIRSCS